MDSFADKAVVIVIVVTTILFITGVGVSLLQAYTRDKPKQKRKREYDPYNPLSMPDYIDNDGISFNGELKRIKDEHDFRLAHIHENSRYEKEMAILDENMRYMREIQDFKKDETE